MGSKLRAACFRSKASKSNRAENFTRPWSSLRGNSTGICLKGVDGGQVTSGATVINLNF